MLIYAVISVLFGVTSGVVVALVSVVVALITAAGGYFIAQRHTSGDVRQTTPDKLWDVADGMRRDLADALEKSYAREDKLRDRITEQDKRLATQDQRITAQDLRIRDLEAEVDVLRRGIPG